MILGAADRRPGRATRRRAAAALVAGALALPGCTPEPAVGDPLAPRRGAAGSWTVIEQQIVVPRCASTSCHGGDPPAAFPRLDAGAGWAAMVNVPSQQAVMDLVEPGDPGASWLMIRLRGEGGRPYMPIGDAQLTQAELDAVEAWIANGALND